MTYYITAKNNSTVNTWEKCNATTLTGAKREATRKLGSGYLDDVLHVGHAMDNDALCVETVAYKSNRDGSKWIEVA